MGGKSFAPYMVNTLDLQRSLPGYRPTSQHKAVNMDKVALNHNYNCLIPGFYKFQQLSEVFISQKYR